MPPLCYALKVCRRKCLDKLRHIRAVLRSTIGLTSGSAPVELELIRLGQLLRRFGELTESILDVSRREQASLKLRRSELVDQIIARVIAAVIIRTRLLPMAQSRQ